ncbi:MAG: pyruvate kinase [Rhodospirillaceae bacterium]|nr:pyruvate kinase [Rhodospirillaceae bacterium]
MRRHRQAKILATLGPASDSPEMIRTLFEAGADVFRLNFSHGSHADHAKRFATIRALEAEAGRPIGILTDLQGPKLRIGDIEDGAIMLEEGASLRLDLDKKKGDAKRVPLPHPEIFAAISEGTDLLLDDGKLRLRVTRAGANFAEAEVITGGKLSDHKGVNVPNAMLPISALGPKDRKDLSFALDQGADFIGLSFVQRPEDIAEARRLIAGRAAIMSKLEKPAAIDHLEEIVSQSDAVMVARGDLGVELPPEDVPVLQKQIIRECREQGKPVVVATQMLESMISSPAPTRAEASDVAAAIYDGADAVMLSAEPAAGDYPLEAVEMMNRIIRRVERDPLFWSLLETSHQDPEATAPDAITAAARQVAHTISAAAIVTYTTSGSTAFRAARERPDAPILCLTERVTTARKLALAWGVQCVIAQDVQDFNDMVEKACHIAVRSEFAQTGKSLVITAGVPFGTPGATNVLRIAWIS